MPTGSGKSILFKHVNSLLQTIRKECGLTNKDPSWTFDDATFEKTGAMMFDNSSRLLGFYDGTFGIFDKNCFGAVRWQIHMSFRNFYNYAMDVDGGKIQVRM